MIAASSLVEGEGLTLRGADYGFGPLLALMLAAILRLAGSVDSAYDWFKAANALLFALTAVPVYLLARRLVSGWWAVLAAGLAVAIPSSISVATVMTESLSYVATAWALYAIMLALERPTVLRQFGVLAATAVAFLTRPQFGILYVTWVGALGAFWVIAPWARPKGRADVLRFWPTALPVVLAVLAFAARLASGASASDSLGRLLGALARLRPAPGRQVVRVPPRRLRRLPRDRAGRGRADRPRGPDASRTSGIEVRDGVRRALRLRQRLRPARRRRVHEHPVGLRPTSRPLRVLPPSAVAHRAGRLARRRPAATARCHRDRRRRRTRAPTDPSLRPARQRGGHRHRPWRALGARGGGAGWAGSCVRPSRPRSFRRRARRGDVSPATRDRPCRAPGRRRRDVRRHVVPRVAADDRGARGPGVRGRPRARLDRRPAAGRRARDEALRRHALRLGPRASCAVPHRVLQLDRRSRRLRPRVGAGWPTDRARRCELGGRAREIARAIRSSRTTSSRSRASGSPADASPRGRRRTWCSGTSAGRCMLSAPARPSSSAGTFAPSAPCGGSRSGCG